MTDRLRGSEADASSVALRTVAALGLAASLLFVGLIVISLSGDDGSDTEVLGSQVEREPPADDTTTERSDVSQAEREPPADGTTTEPPESTGTAGDIEVASTAGGAFFVYAEDPQDNVEGSAAVIERGAGGVSLTVSGVPHEDRATIRATVENAGDDAIVFEDGLSVAVHLDYEGTPWRTVEPSDRSITELRPGERASVSTEIELDGFGHYDLTGDVFFAR